MRDFKKYEVWQISHRLVLDIYRFSKEFSNDEKFNLTSQLRRAAASIPTNISEGCGRKSDREFGHYLNIALGSASETEYLVILVRDLHYLDNSDAEILLEKINHVKSKIYKLKEKLNPH